MLSPAMRPCSPNPVCGPAPIPRLPRQSGWKTVGDFLDRHVTAPIRCWRDRERLYAELCRLDHRELRDLGLDDGDIPVLVAGWRPVQAHSPKRR